MSPEIHPADIATPESGGPWGLPSGWRWVPLRDCVQPTERADPSLSPDRPFTYIDISSIDSKMGKIVKPKTLSGTEAPSRARKRVRAGDVLFATTRPNLRNVAIVPSDLNQAVCSTGFCVLRAREIVRPRWLFWLGRSSFLVSHLAPRIRGANYPAVTDRDVLSALVPIAEPEVQDRTLERVDALMGEIQEVHSLLAAIRSDTNQVLSAALEEIVRNLDGKFNRVSIGELVASERIQIMGGGTPSTLNEAYWSGPLPWVSPKDMKRWLIEDAEDHISQLALGETTVKRIPLGAVLVVVRGMILAHTWPIAITSVDVAINQDMKALCPDSTLRPEYLGYILRARSRQVLSVVESSAHGTRRLRTENLFRVLVPDASLSAQDETIAYLDEVQSHVGEMRRLQAQDSDCLDQLEQAILERAFRGKLWQPHGGIPE